MIVSVLEHVTEPQRLLPRCAGCWPRAASRWSTCRRGAARSTSSSRRSACGLSPAAEMDDHKMYYDVRDLWPLLVAAGFRPSRIRCFTHKFGLEHVRRLPGRVARRDLRGAAARRGRGRRGGAGRGPRCRSAPRSRGASGRPPRGCRSRRAATATWATRAGRQSPASVGSAGKRRKPRRRDDARVHRKRASPGKPPARKNIVRLRRAPRARGSRRAAPCRRRRRP